MLEYNVIDHLCAKGFKTQTALAAAAEASQGSVADWKRANGLPYRRMLLIMENSRLLDIELVPDDFFPPDFRSQDPASKEVPA